MRKTASAGVDRGQYPDVVTPWDDTVWRSAALEWVEDRLAARGLRTTGERRVRLRPWSVLLRVSVRDAGPVWFKANPPGSAFEAALGAELARWVPEHVLEPLAVDAGRGWSLLPDGGPLLRTAIEERRVDDARVWEDVLRQYALVQRALVPHTDAIGRLGVPAARTAALPEVFDRLLEAVSAAGGLRSEERRALHAQRPRLLQWCAELAAAGVPDTLDHADLHAGQLFRPAPGRFTFFDWGDASVGHPFRGLLVPARAALERHGPEVLPRLLDAYLEPWTGAGRTPAELRRAVRPAWRLGALGRAASWGRVFSTVPDAALAQQSGRSLLHLLTEPPL
ncbi:phosphotransferase [Streptomyces sp. NPDC004065]|uniref:phosphotransferase n=1 Tax=Streptomyces sp. NPDC004065 TaxID=3364689 RepID=UPI00384DC92A